MNAPFDTSLPSLSRRTANLHASPIREILAVIDRPGMISFAGGLPASETFPKMDVSAMPATTLQYGASEGEPALRARVAEELSRLGLRVSTDQVLIVSGSQQGIDLVGKLFIDEGTPIAVENPTYLAALQVFRFFGARFAGFDPKDPRSLPATIAAHRPALAYAIPTFQNPTGHCYSAAERAALANTCDTHGLTLFEDDPYRDLVFDACDRTPVCAQLSRAPWIYQGSFSKSLAPGVRLGYLACSPTLVPMLTRLKQAADLHSNRVSQWWVLQQLNAPDRDARLKHLADTYRSKRDAFAQGLNAHFKDLATWSTPQGGLFFWLQLKSPLDTGALLKEAIAQNVAFMPGEPFYANETPHNATLRLNFSHAAPDRAAQGLQTLASLIRQAKS
jgi:2-aminoadipate transaminase